MLDKIFDKPICDNCLGRLRAQLLTGYSNDERGKVIRDFIASSIDGKTFDIKNIDKSNFSGYKFRNMKLKSKTKKCYYCDDFFKNIDKFVKKVGEKLKKYEFNTLLVGTVLSNELIKKEEELWHKGGIEFCEPIKVEINREVGKRLGEKLNKEADLRNPDIAILLNLEKNKIKLGVRSLYVFGYYQKLKGGFPQCKWGTPKKYKTSIEEIIGIPLLKMAKGKDHKFHGAGREDIDATCTGWRPFVIEIVNPLKRKVDLKLLFKKINKSKKVHVKGLKFSNTKTTVKIKTMTPDKTYRALVKLSKKIKKKDLKRLSKLKGVITQKTPNRVKHRRANLTRKRRVKSIKVKYKNSKTIEIIVKGTSGLYIKELISGDEGRTKPNVSDILGVKAKCKKLDVIEIQKRKI